MNNPPTTPQQPPNNPHSTIDIDSIDFYAPPTPAVVAAMRALGLFDARTPSLALRPWWTAIDVSLKHGTREYYAQASYRCFDRAQRYNPKGERFRNEKKWRSCGSSCPGDRTTKLGAQIAPIPRRSLCRCRGTRAIS